MLVQCVFVTTSDIMEQGQRTHADLTFALCLLHILGEFPRQTFPPPVSQIRISAYSGRGTGLGGENSMMKKTGFVLVKLN